MFLLCSACLTAGIQGTSASTLLTDGVACKTRRQATQRPASATQAMVNPPIATRQNHLE